MIQQELDFTAVREPIFQGSDYDHARDSKRLTGQLQKVYDCMKDAQWRTLDKIATATGAPHASVSAQLRNLRKIPFGAHTIEKRHVEGGLFEYRLVV